MDAWRKPGFYLETSGYSLHIKRLFLGVATSVVTPSRLQRDFFREVQRGTRITVSGIGLTQQKESSSMVNSFSKCQGVLCSNIESGAEKGL